MTKKDAFIVETAKDIEPEFHITNLLKQLRTMEGLLKDKLSEQEWVTGY